MKRAKDGDVAHRLHRYRSLCLGVGLLALAACRPPGSPAAPSTPALDANAVPRVDSRANTGRGDADPGGAALHFQIYDNWLELRDVEEGSGDRVGRASLFDPTGDLLAQASLQRDDAETASAFFIGAQGDSVRIEPGHRLEVASAGLRRSLVVPDPRLRFDRAGGRVELRLLEERREVAAADSGENPESDPGIEAGLELRGDASLHPPTSTSASDPPYGWSIPNGDLSGGDAITLTLTSGTDGWRMIQRRRVPFVRVSLLPGDITGAMDPLSMVEASLQDAAGRRLAEGRGRADASGRFALWLHDDDGRRIRAAEGDRLVLSSDTNTLELVVPPSGVRWDLEAERLEGFGPTESRVEVTKWNPWHADDAEAPATRSDDSGTWRIDLERPIRPATHFYVTQWLPLGDRLYDCRQVPMLHVEPGSPVVEVQTLWDARARIDLIRDGEVVAGAAGGGMWSGNLTLVLTDAEGVEIAVREGDRIEAEIDGQAYALDVGVLEVEPQEGVRFVGRTLPETRVGLARNETPADEPVLSDEDGRFVLPVDEPRRFAGLDERLAFDERVEVFAATPSEHNLRRRIAAPGFALELGSRNLRGQAEPRSAVRVRRDQGSWLSTGADSRGRWSIALPDGEPPWSESDALQLRVGDLDSSIVVPEMEVTFYFDPWREWPYAGASLIGQAPPDTLVDIRAFTADPDPPYTFSATTDASGRWKLALDDPPEGLPFPPLERVVRFEIETEIVLEAGRGSYPLRVEVPNPAALNR